MPQLNGFEPV